MQPWATKRYRSCPTCGGSGKVWWTETKYWREGEREPKSHPTLITCWSCHGACVQRQPDHPADQYATPQ